MSKYPKCPHCNSDITNKATAIKKSNRYICSKECYDILYPVKQTKKSIQDEQKKYRQHLISNLKIVYGEQYNTMFMNTQIKRFREEFGIDEKQICDILEYYCNILGNEIDIQYGLQWIVSKYNIEAKQFFEQKEKIKNSLTDIDVCDKIVTVKKYKQNKKEFIYEE